MGRSWFRAGINCSVVPFDVASDLPGHVVVAFNTKGNGMIYIDPASLNASSADFPGIAYDKIIFLRDQWNHTLSVQDGGNGSITVREYRKARPVSYNDMVQFLAMDDTDRNPGRANATSADFAVRLHDNAEAAGLLNAIVLVHFIEENYTTYLNAFATVEKGVVYIDDLNTVDPVLSTIFKPHDNVAYLAYGSKMGALPIELIGGNLDYDYFLNQNAMIDPIFKDAMLYIEGIGGLDFDLSLYQERLQANKDSYTRYLEDRAKLDAEMKQYRSNFQNRTTDWPTLVRRSEGLDQKLNEIRYTSNMLEQEKQLLDKRQDNLDKKRESLAAREENKWLSYYPRVTVKEIQILW
jgi:hypothetical protein